MRISKIKIVVLGDPHAKPGISNDRFLWAGRLVLEERPDYVVEMGDWADLPSLSSYDKGKASHEGKRYTLDIEAANEALELFEAPIREYNIQQKKNGKKQYKPKRIAIIGNHEDRISRAVNSNPELEGTMSLEDIQFKKYAWETIPYRTPITIEGINFSHNFPSGVRGEAISGANIGASLLAKCMESVCVGHIHVYDHAMRTTPSGKRYHGISVGCYHEHTDDYALNTGHLWWRGAVIFHDVKDGDFDLQTISLKKIKEKYGSN